MATKPPTSWDMSSSSTDSTWIQRIRYLIHWNTCRPSNVLLGLGQAHSGHWNFWSWAHVAELKTPSNVWRQSKQSKQTLGGPHVAYVDPIWEMLGLCWAYIYVGDGTPSTQDFTGPPVTSSHLFPQVTQLQDRMIWSSMGLWYSFSWGWLKMKS